MSEIQISTIKSRYSRAVTSRLYSYPFNEANYGQIRVIRSTDGSKVRIASPPPGCHDGNKSAPFPDLLNCVPVFPGYIELFGTVVPQESLSTAAILWRGTKTLDDSCMRTGSGDAYVPACILDTCYRSTLGFPIGENSFAVQVGC